MKLRTKVVVGTILVVVAMMASIYGAGTSAGAPVASRFHVIYLAVGLNNTYAAAQVKNAKAEAKRLNIDLTVLNGNFSSSLQSQQLAAAIAQKPDGIIAFPTDSSAIIPQTVAAQKAGIPITFVTQDIAASGQKYRQAYSGPDNYTQGIHQFDLLRRGILANGTKGVPKIAMLQSFAGSAANVLRVKGFKDEMAKTGYKMDIVAQGFGESDITKSRGVMAQILTRYGSELNGVYTQDDNVAAGAASAVSAAGLSKQMPIVGNGFEKIVKADIIKGTVYGTLNQSPRLDGETCIKVMNAILTHKPYRKITFLPQPQITKANVNQYVAEW